MSIKSLITVMFTAIFTITSAHAYTIESRFETKHYGVYQVKLGKGEVYAAGLKQIIAKDLGSRKKFQATAAVYPFGSAGMNGTIKEPVLGIITTENYDGAKTFTVNIEDKIKTSSYVGIFIKFKQLSKISDNRTVNSLTTELAQVPLVLEGVPVSTVSTDYNGKLFYIATAGSLVIDFNVIDSLFYKRKKLEEVTDKCTVNILAIPDRYTEDAPFFIAAHGAVNDIMCEK